jgi:Skp family chaperone for outer membrane proteins
MHSKPIASALCAAALTLAAAPAALAQTPPAPPPVRQGPAIAGLCIINIENAIGASTVGGYVNTRMQQIVAQVNAELNGEKTAIDNEAKTLDTQSATLDRTVLEQRAAALQVRANALQRKAQQREREISATEQKAIGRVGQEMEPLIRQAYEQKACSVLLQRNAVVIANPAADITQLVVTALNAKITQFAFDRERLDQAALPQPAAPGRPATPPAAAAPPAPPRR